MIEVEVLGLESMAPAPTATSAEVRDLCLLAARSRGVADGHVAVEFVDAARITELNCEHRGKQAPTDVLSFPIDGVEERPAPPPSSNGVPCELGDIVICPQHTHDLREAVVHGMLHLLGMDHETDDGEMLALQAQLLAPGR
jgi:probable rRNA maturation factor